MQRDDVDAGLPDTLVGVKPAGDAIESEPAGLGEGGIADDRHRRSRSIDRDQGASVRILLDDAVQCGWDRCNPGIAHGPGKERVRLVPRQLAAVDEILRHGLAGIAGRIGRRPITAGLEILKGTGMAVDDELIEIQGGEFGVTAVRAARTTVADRTCTIAVLA